MPGEDLAAQRPDKRAVGPAAGSGARPCSSPSPSAPHRGRGTEAEASPGLRGGGGSPRGGRSPRPHRLRGCAAAGILHPGRFCLPRANSRGLKVFHLERQSAFFLSISGQTPMVPGTSLLPNGGAAFSFRLRVILLALLCWNRA